MDSRDLIERQEELKQEVLDSFIDTFPQYEHMTDEYDDILWEEEEIVSWKDDLLDEIAEIGAIEALKDEVDSSEWEYGIDFIEEKDFIDYCEELTIDCGYISKDLPAFIYNNIDWEGVADDLRIDYSEVTYEGKDYLFQD